MYAFGEDGFGDCGNRDHCGGVCEAGGIPIWAEDGNFVIGGAESFHPFVSLLPIVEGRSHAMEAEEGVCYEFGFGPDASLDAVVRFDVAIDCWALARAKCIEGERNVAWAAESSVYLRGHGNQCRSSQWCLRVEVGMPFLRVLYVKVVRSEEQRRRESFKGQKAVFK